MNPPFSPPDTPGPVKSTEPHLIEPRPLIAARSDEEQILTWLAEHTDSPRTQASYRKEAERLMLWLYPRQLSLAQLSREDVLAYERFLQNPPAEWVGPARPRHHPDWRPLTGPLSPNSIRHAMTVLGALYGYLIDAGVLRGNPFRLVKKRRSNGTAKHLGVERFLDNASWQRVLDEIDQLPRDTPRQQEHATRAEWLFTLLYLTGARRSEIAQARMGDCFERRGRWWWRVYGKGGSVADVPVGEELLLALTRYRRQLGLPEHPHPGEESPLVGRLTGDSEKRLEPLSDKAIYLVVREVLRRTATRSDDPAIRQVLESASTHWLRHTAASHQLDAGVPLLMVSQNLRHASIQTTRRYLHSEDDARHAETGRHSMTRRNKPDSL
ncbi:site-specific integrase [Crenobacter sp. SG2303]|uniref:Site-specific integrase n=1 Tax=Crenobacter oryzisoli TaxID=3056844 RepID=A0ABT7XIJ9_9NEIS|nr:site-specific integrase [Crenobacter sp. SG2303]MDN0073606.1 site-specific integrase [Crenobacter sp. SG2303]